MAAPYTFDQVKEMIPTLDGDQIELLRAGVNEDRASYTIPQLVEIYQLIMMRIQELWRIERENMENTDQSMPM